MKSFIILLLLIPSLVFSQKSERVVRKGLIACKATLAVGSPEAYEGINTYISGNIEYYLEDNVSFKGGVAVFLGTSDAENTFAKNSSVFNGFYYHLPTKNGLDPYIGLNIGFSWTQLKEPDNLDDYPSSYSISNYPQTISPVTSPAIGLNYYATNFAHIFIEGKYVYGVHVSDISGVSLNEFRLAFGFGFNLFTIKK